MMCWGYQIKTVSVKSGSYLHGTIVFPNSLSFSGYPTCIIGNEQDDERASFLISCWTSNTYTNYHAYNNGGSTRSLYAIHYIAFGKYV